MNPVRGEADAKIGPITVTMALTMSGLAALSAATGRPALHELYQRLVAGEMHTVQTAIELLTIRGKKDDGSALKAPAAVRQALDALSLEDLDALRLAFAEMLTALVREEAPAVPNG